MCESGLQAAVTLASFRPSSHLNRSVVCTPLTCGPVQTSVQQQLSKLGGLKDMTGGVGKRVSANPLGSFMRTSPCEAPCIVVASNP